MVCGVKVKRSKNKNFQTTNPSYPRDIWEFIAKSKERVQNTSTGALLKDVLDFQSLTPQQQAKIQAETEFPKTIFPKIDPEILKPRAVSVDADVLAARAASDRRKKFLDSGGPKGKKHRLNDHTKGHFDVHATEEMIEHYKKNRPKWLQPKNKEVRHEEKKKVFDMSRGISKAEQEEMMTAAVFADARNKTDRAIGLRKQFHHNLLEGKLMRVQADLGLNRVFFGPERHKLDDLDMHFASKMLDPNLDIRVIESASPTKFFEMVHRRLNPSHYHPEGYEDIVTALTPEPEDNLPTQDFHKSPYLTYLRHRAKVDVKLEPHKPHRFGETELKDWKWEYGRYHPRPGDEERWGRRTFESIDTLAERVADKGKAALGIVPQGLGRSVQLNASNVSRDSPWMGGGIGSGSEPRSPVNKKLHVPPSPEMASITKSSSSVFITQKSGPI